MVNEFFIGDWRLVNEMFEVCNADNILVEISEIAIQLSLFPATSKKKIYRLWRQFKKVVNLEKNHKIFENRDKFDQLFCVFSRFIHLNLDISHLVTAIR